MLKMQQNFLYDLGESVSLLGCFLQRTVVSSDWKTVTRLLYYITKFTDNQGQF